MLTVPDLAGSHAVPSQMWRRYMANRGELPAKKSKLPTAAWTYAAAIALALGITVWGFWLIDYSRSG